MTHSALKHCTLLLYLECSRDNTRLMPLSIASPAFRNVLGIVRCDYLLARVGIVHDRLSVGEESVEQPVEDARGEERVDIADREAVRDHWSAIEHGTLAQEKSSQMLTAYRNARAGTSGCNNVVDEAR